MTAELLWFAIMRSARSTGLISDKDCIRAKIMVVSHIPNSEIEMMIQEVIIVQVCWALVLPHRLLCGELA